MSYLINNHMKRNFIFLLFFIIASSYVKSQTVVNLNLPYNCNSTHVGIDEQKGNKHAKLVIFPNPSEGNFTINVEYKNNIEKATIRIYNYEGKIVLNESIYCNSTKFIKQINLQNIVSGNYIVVFKNAEKEISTKLIIK